MTATVSESGFFSIGNGSAAGTVNFSEGFRSAMDSTDHRMQASSDEVDVLINPIQKQLPEEAQKLIREPHRNVTDDGSSITPEQEDKEYRKEIRAARLRGSFQKPPEITLCQICGVPSHEEMFSNCLLYTSPSPRD